MPSESLMNDRRGLVFTIDRQQEPVYQVDAKHWARTDHRWDRDQIPPEIRAKVAELRRSGRPGAFVRFLHGEEGVYVLCEENIKNIPDIAGDEIVLNPLTQPQGDRRLSPYDIVICTKGGTIRGDNGDIFETKEGEYYVIECRTWSRFATNQATRPQDVETTKKMLLLLDKLHGKNFLSMSPDEVTKALPWDIGEPTDPGYHINCYVLNLARFKR